MLKKLAVISIAAAYMASAVPGYANGPDTQGPDEGIIINLGDGTCAVVVDGSVVLELPCPREFRGD